MMITPCLGFAKINYLREPALMLAVIFSTSTDALIGCHALIAPNSQFGLLAIRSSPICFMSGIFHIVSSQPGLCCPICITVSFTVLWFWGIVLFFFKFTTTIEK